MMQGCAATETKTIDVQPPTESGVPPKRVWRLATTNVADLLIEQDKDGRYLLTVAYNDGHRLEHDVTSAIHAAVEHEAESLRQRIAELELEVERAKEWIRRFLGQ